MKVNFSNEPTKAEIQNVAVGSTFLCKRTGIKEIGLYMRIDKNSGILTMKSPNRIVAVNLLTGQLRQFCPTDLVTPSKAEVTCKYSLVDIL